MNTTGSSRGQIVYFSHGGGPLPILGDPSHDKMVNFMRDLPAGLNKPSAIVVFSAHWEEDPIAIQSGEHPALIYDYYGFPPESYTLRYPCKGSPKIAQRISDLLGIGQVPHRLDEGRPYDHGSYIPLRMMYPEADLPVVQISLHRSLDPKIHLALGAALRPLLDEGVLVIGSGFSFHNMRKFDFAGSEFIDPENDAFQDKLIELCTQPNTAAAQWQEIINWKIWRGAKYCHPREEHLVPLFVCVGMSEAPGETVFDDYILGKRAVAFLWR